jgi:hypothetical protein
MSRSSRLRLAGRADVLVRRGRGVAGVGHRSARPLLGLIGGVGPGRSYATVDDAFPLPAASPQVGDNEVILAVELSWAPPARVADRSVRGVRTNSANPVHMPAILKGGCHTEALFGETVATVRAGETSSHSRDVGPCGRLCVGDGRLWKPVVRERPDPQGVDGSTSTDPEERRVGTLRRALGGRDRGCRPIACRPMTKESR